MEEKTNMLKKIIIVKSRETECKNLMVPYKNTKHIRAKLKNWELHT